ncbi:response regulator [Flavobacterium rhizosphaerae]|uniref:Response regulator n=1 Tax=Flavobacterium rhizosphaerae TaxID=3163298 RepID=A0ABW8Z1H3_9FLAO
MMKNTFNCIMIVDDNKIDNFFHERVILKNNITNTVIIKQSGIEALEYLQDNNNVLPEIIFLDIHMPEMTGWEFLDQYIQLDKLKQKSKIIVMLGTQNFIDDNTEKFKELLHINFTTKPLTTEFLNSLTQF